MRVGIFFGGLAPEHEISIITAYQVKEKIEEDHECYLLYVKGLGQIYDASRKQIKDFKKKKLKMNKAVLYDCGFNKKRLDVAIICTHGENGEDGTLAGLLKFYGIPYVGSEMFSSALFMDKNLTHRFLDKYDICTRAISYSRDDYIKNKEIPFMPCIVKPSRLGSSIGISVCKDKKMLKDALSLGFLYDYELIIEEYLEGFKEYNVACSNNYISKVETIQNKNDIFSFEDKYEDAFKHSHKTIVEDNGITLRIKEIARMIYVDFKLKGIARYDFMVTPSKIYLGEVNTIPGALASYLFDDFKKVINDEIRIAIKESFYRKENIRICQTGILDNKIIKK